MTNGGVGDESESGDGDGVSLIQTRSAYGRERVTRRTALLKRLRSVGCAS